MEFENKDYTVLEERSLTEKETAFFSSLYETKKLESEKLKDDFFIPIYRVILP